MTYLVGYTADRSGADALALGRMLSVDARIDLTVCMVIPEEWSYPSPANVGAEYRSFLESYSEKALKKAGTTLGPSIKAQFVTQAARSGAVGLAQVANDISAELIVLGSAKHGPAMRCSFGSVASGVLAHTDRPVIMAPRSFRLGGARTLQRVTCAYTNEAESARVLAAAVALCQRHDVPLRLVTFVVRDKQMYPTGAGYEAENMVANTWRSQAIAAQGEAISELPTGIVASGTIGDGPDWRSAIAAIEWLGGEILVAGSHHMGRVSGWLFGTAFTRLLRYVTVPLVAIP